MQRHSQPRVRSLLSTAYYEENLWLITSFIPFNALHFVASLQLRAKIIDSFSQWWFCGREPRIMVMQRRTLRAKYCKKRNCCGERHRKNI